MLLSQCRGAQPATSKRVKHDNGELHSQIFSQDVISIRGVSNQLAIIKRLITTKSSIKNHYRSLRSGPLQGQLKTIGRQTKC